MISAAGTREANDVECLSEKDAGQRALSLSLSRSRTERERETGMGSFRNGEEGMAVCERAESELSARKLP